MSIRGLLADLKESVGAETVCRLCEVDRDDLDLLAVVERELRDNEKSAGVNQDGEGH